MFPIWCQDSCRYMSARVVSFVHIYGLQILVCMIEGIYISCSWEHCLMNMTNLWLKSARLHSVLRVSPCHRLLFLCAWELCQLIISACLQGKKLCDILPVLFHKSVHILTLLDLSSWCYDKLYHIDNSPSPVVPQLNSFKLLCYYKKFTLRHKYFRHLHQTNTYIHSHLRHRTSPVWLH